MKVDIWKWSNTGGGRCSDMDILLYIGGIGTESKVIPYRHIDTDMMYL